jgi:hypothetical protein
MTELVNAIKAKMDLVWRKLLKANVQHKEKKIIKLQRKLIQLELKLKQMENK